MVDTALRSECELRACELQFEDDHGLSPTFAMPKVTGIVNIDAGLERKPYLLLKSSGHWKMRGINSPRSVIVSTGRSSFNDEHIRSESESDLLGDYYLQKSESAKQAQTLSNPGHLRRARNWFQNRVSRIHQDSGESLVNPAQKE
jgi:hypothetical protein